jgi:hypothetical protein
LLIPLPKKWKILHLLKVHKVTVRPFIAPLIFKAMVEVVVLLLLLLVAMVVVMVVVVVVMLLLQAMMVVVVMVVVPAAAMVLAKWQVKVNHVKEVAPDSALQKWNLCVNPLSAFCLLVVPNGRLLQART